MDSGKIKSSRPCRRSRLCIAFILVLGLVTDVSGETGDWQPTIQTGSETIQLCSWAKVKVLRFIHLADGALYLNECSEPESVMAPIAKQYHTRALKNIEGKRLADSARKLLARNFPNDDLDDETLQAFECMNSAYPNLTPGDELGVRYAPGSGISMHLNGELLTSCQPAQNAHRYFAIWFGEDPLNKSLKASLLSATRQ